MMRRSPSRPNSFLFNLFLTISLSISSLQIIITRPVVEAGKNNGSVPVVKVNVGVILDGFQSSTTGKAIMSSIDMALSDLYSSRSNNYTTRLVLNTKDSKNDVVTSAAAALDLIKNVRVQAILGPTTSMQADFTIDLGERAQVPILTFTATNPSLTSIRSPYFFRATQNDSTQATAISALMQAYGWRQAVPIYVDNQFGQGILPYLIDALQAVNVRVPYRSLISPVATDDQIVEELYKLMTMQTRVFIVHMNQDLGSRLFSKAREVGMMSDGYVWIMTDGITDFFSALDHSVVDSMQGVLGVRPYVPRSRKLKSFEVRWKRKFQQDNPDVVDANLDVFSLWGYDATTALAIAIERAGSTDLRYQAANSSGNSSTDLDSFGVSLNGPKLLQTLSNTNFKGLTGDFRFVDGQLPAAIYQIINVNGDSPRDIGFWTQDRGFSKTLQAGSSAYNTSISSLAPVIWPGGTTSVPRGWQIPTSGKKLRIGVPLKNGFVEFVNVTNDPNTNTTSVSGYCIDVFDAVVQALPYALSYEYIPFSKTNGSTQIPAGTYDDLVYQVYLGNFDAVVGDTTIVANRSLYVDFTLPYTESGVSMIVPVTNGRSNNAWVFLKPLTWDLWVTTLCFFVFIGFVVWVLEHRINEDFRGPPSHQVGTLFWFSFSSMVFAQRERVISNLARMVVIVWFFVVLILTQSYTASLTSLLTVQRLQPTVTDVNQLIRKGENVGYLKGSFVLGILQGLGFDESKIIIYKSPDECNELFIKGSKNGGIAAAFDEVPYTKVFLAQHCSKYTTSEPTFKTDGFGFVFPIGSPLVSDISRAVLKVTEGEKMKRIEKAWFGKQSDCPETSTTVTSNSLDMSSFWGLFLIAGIAATFALLLSVALFVYKHRENLQDSESMASVWSRIRKLLHVYDEKNHESFTFRNITLSHPNTSGAPSPSANSVRQEFSEQGTPARDNAADDRDTDSDRQPPREATGGQVPPSSTSLNIELENSIHVRQTCEITEEPN